MEIKLLFSLSPHNETALEFEFSALRSIIIFIPRSEY